MDNACYTPGPKTITLRWRGQKVECPVLSRGNLVQAEVSAFREYRWYKIQLPNGKTKMILRPE